MTETSVIEYIYVEMVFNPKGKLNKYDVISGLLQGIKIHLGSTFILLHGKKGATNVVNLAFYDIMTVEVRHKEYKDMTHLTTKDSDQKFALNLLNTLHKDFL